jgi:hypothetical protein
MLVKILSYVYDLFVLSCKQKKQVMNLFAYVLKMTTSAVFFAVVMFS